MDDSWENEVKSVKSICFDMRCQEVAGVRKNLFKCSTKCWKVGDITLILRRCPILKNIVRIQPLFRLACFQWGKAWVNFGLVDQVPKLSRNEMAKVRESHLCVNEGGDEGISKIPHLQFNVLPSGRLFGFPELWRQFHKFSVRKVGVRGRGWENEAQQFILGLNGNPEILLGFESNGTRSDWKHSTHWGSEVKCFDSQVVNVEATPVTVVLPQPCHFHHTSSCPRIPGNSLKLS